MKVTSPADNSVTSGHLCIKGRFGFQFVQNRKGDDPLARKRRAERERDRARDADADTSESAS